MSRFTQSRRWAVDHRRDRRGQISENDITPEEARAALHAVCIQCGHVFEDLLEYDPARDVFRLEARDQDGALRDMKVPGGVVAQVVVAARLLSARQGHGLIADLKELALSPLRRNYERTLKVTE